MSNLSSAKARLFVQQFKPGQIVRVINKAPGLRASIGALAYIKEVYDTNLEVVWIRNVDVPKEQFDGNFYASQFEPFGTLDIKLNI